MAFEYSFSQNDLRAAKGEFGHPIAHAADFPSRGALRAMIEGRPPIPCPAFRPVPTRSAPVGSPLRGLAGRWAFRVRAVGYCGTVDAVPRGAALVV